MMLQTKNSTRLEITITKPNYVLFNSIAGTVVLVGILVFAIGLFAREI